MFGLINQCFVQFMVHVYECYRNMKVFFHPSQTIKVEFPRKPCHLCYSELESYFIFLDYKCFMALEFVILSSVMMFVSG